MFLWKTVLVAFVVILCVNFIQETEADSKLKSIGTNLRANRLQRYRGLLKHGRKHVSQVRCLANTRLCLLKPNLKQCQCKIRRPHENRKKDKRCCVKRNKQCQKKFRKRCKTTKCLIKQSRKCRKQFVKCNKRKSTNRRPGNCGPYRGRKVSRNDRPRSPSVSTTTVKPVIKKRKKQECSATDECEEGLCCARHQHVRICKPLIPIDQVCTREYKSIKRSPEMYERCPCEDGLVCSGSQSGGRHYTCQVKT